MNLTTQQLAELLIGIARSQQAIIDAVEGVKAGFKGTHLGPALDSAAKIRSGRAVTLLEYPSRVLLQCQGRVGPNVEQIVKDLDEVLSGKAAVPSTVAPATVRAAAKAARAAPPAAAPAAPAAGAAAPTPAAASDSNDLDMTK